VEIDVRNDMQPKEISDTGRRQLRKMMTDLNLRVAAIRFPTQRGYDVLQDLDRRIDATKEAMKFAHSMGAGVVVNSIGYVPEDPLHPAYQQLVESLNDLGRYGQHIGAILACETGSEPVERLVGLLNGLAEQAIGIAFNPGNLIVNDCYSENAIAKCAGLTMLVHACDGVRDLARGRGLAVPLGRGVAEFPQILGVLEEQHYGGWFILEGTQSLEPVAELRHAVSYLKAL
jgi:sugar phosphate isomerase/epimerase